MSLFSVGDFIAVGGVIADIVSSLKDSTGSKSDYQELIRELDALDRALKSLDKLQPTVSSLGTVDSIKCAAISCRVPLEEFLSKIKKYEVALGPRPPASSIASSSKSLVKKITWLSKGEDVDRLRKYLSVHLGTINMLLLEHGLQTMDVSSKALQDQCGDIQGSLRGIDHMVTATATGVRNLTALVQTTHRILTSLFSMISGEVRSSLSQIARSTQNASLLSQRIFEAVVQLQASVSAINVDTRWNYFQAPVKVEDALGRVFPVPSEYTMCELHAILRYRFRRGPGREQVQHGDFKLTDRRNMTVVDRSSMPSLLPGLDIIMSIMVDVDGLRSNDEVCPMCLSDNTIPARWGGRTWWFDTSDSSTFSRRRIEEVDSEESGDDSDIEEDGDSDSELTTPARRRTKRLKRTKDDTAGDPSLPMVDLGSIRNLTCVRSFLPPRLEAYMAKSGILDSTDTVTTGSLDPGRDGITNSFIGIADDWQISEDWRSRTLLGVEPLDAADRDMLPEEWDDWYNSDLYEGHGGF